MLKTLRAHRTTVVVAMLTALVTSATPTVAGIVADYARNAGKVDGKHAVSASATTAQRKGKLVATSATTGRLPTSIIDLSKQQRKCANGAVLAFARVEPIDVSPTELSSSGITESFNCRGQGARVMEGGAGVFLVHFPGVMSGFDPEAVEYVAYGNVEGGARTIGIDATTVDTGSETVGALSVRLWNTSSGTADETDFSVTLVRVDT